MRMTSFTHKTQNVKVIKNEQQIEIKLSKPAGTNGILCVAREFNLPDAFKLGMHL